MCTYCTTNNYRKIYENHIGPIPYDSDGRSYDIHHIDNDHSNNDPNNLIAVTVQEHYDIHYSQGNYGACRLIKQQRMYLSPEERSHLSSKLAIQRSENGTHPFLGGEIQRIRIENGTHNFLSGEIQRKSNQKRLTNKTHNFLSHTKISCIYCRSVFSSGMFTRWHGTKCKQRK